MRDALHGDAPYVPRSCVVGHKVDPGVLVGIDGRPDADSECRSEASPQGTIRVFEPDLTGTTPFVPFPVVTADVSRVAAEDKALPSGARRVVKKAET